MGKKSAVAMEEEGYRKKVMISVWIAESVKRAANRSPAQDRNMISLLFIWREESRFLGSFQRICLNLRCVLSFMENKDPRSSPCANATS